MSPVLGDLHCESEVSHAQLVCVESICTVNPRCLAVAMLSMPAMSIAVLIHRGFPNENHRRKIAKAVE